MNDSRFVSWLSAALLVAITASGNALGARGIDDANAGSAAVQRGQYDAAIQLFTKAINSGELSPDNLATAYVNRGTAHYLKKEHEQAIADFKQAIQLDPRDPIAYIANGQWIWSCGQFKRAIELKPDFQDAIDNYGKQCAR